MFLRQIVFIVLTLNICRANYSNKWLIKGDFTYEEIHRIAERFGFQVLKKVISFKIFIVTALSFLSIKILAFYKNLETK
jgi:hypothetical protein